MNKPSKQFLLDSMRCAYCVGCYLLVWRLAPQPFRCYCSRCIEIYQYENERDLGPSSWLSFDELPTAVWGTRASHLYSIDPADVERRKTRRNAEKARNQASGR